jgi:dTDP-glucose pyrophosphorylase
MRGLKNAVLLAGGRGTRLQPFTDAAPKPMLHGESGNALGLTLRAARRAGIKRVCMVTHHMEEKIREYVGSGAAWQLEVTYAHQAQLKGSADALLSVLEDQPEWIDRSGPVLVSAADYLMHEDMLADLAEAYLRGGCDIAVSLKECPPEELSSRSSVALGEDGRVLHIVEKPAAGEAPSRFAASLIYILPPEIWDLLASVQPSSRGELEIQSAVNHLLREGFTAYGLIQPAPAEWQANSLHPGAALS